MSAWDGTTGVDSVATSIVQEFLVKLLNNTFSNKLSEDLYRHFLEPRNLNYAAGVLLLMLHDDSLEHWFDDPGTEVVEDRQQAIVKSLTEAHDSLAEALGDDVSDWRWGEIHRLTFEHRMGSVPPFKWLWNIGPVEFPGDMSTVNPGRHGALERKPYQVTAGASMRHVIDFGHFEDSGLVITTGQSGRWLSPYYDDQAELWLDMRSLEVSMDREAIEKDAIGRTVFVPSTPLP